MASAEDLYAEYVGGGRGLILRMVSESWQEGPLLDFKTAERHCAPMTKSDRKNLAETLSGFANADGGVVIWGVDARPSGQGEPDAAQEVKPIAELELFLSDLQRLTPQVASPGVVGVEHHPVPQAAGQNSGFVISLVPRSESALHMAVAADQHRYYYRSGTSFLPMEAYMVADRLGRRPQPRLELDVRLVRGSATATHQKVKAVLGISNTGRGVALYPALGVLETPGWILDNYGLDGNGRTGLPRRARSGDLHDEPMPLFAGGSDVAIHPGTTLEVTCMTAQVPRAQGDYPDLRLAHELYCEGFSFRGDMVVPVSEFISSLRQPQDA